ncbi:MAG: FtsX-like permease family protein [Roseiflexaceae bacterium]|nr:FtsX-like permease family protein [Roseiflexaceae bacterium]
MPLRKLWILAYRDLGRNRRRSLITLIAVALGLALLIVMNGLIAGITEDSLQNSIRLRTGHLQMRATSYNEEKLSLQWKDLLSDPDGLAAQAAALPEVKAAAPVLWASGILATTADSAGLQVYGIDTASPIYAPIREGLVAGAYLQPDDRNGILIGKRLADSLNIEVGRKVSLAIISSDGQVDDGIFTIRGLFTTGIPSYDQSAALMPLSKAQAFTNTDGRASAIVILLNTQADSNRVAAALRSPDLSVLTWADLNQLFIQAIQTAMGFYVLLDAIVMLIVAVIIANTLLMSVFERIREMGILSALGMKGQHVMQLFLLEAASLGLIGISIGIGLGLAGVAYLATIGIRIGDSYASAAGTSIALGTTMRARFDLDMFARLSLATLIIIVLASLYPAWFAARLEPAEALRS